MRDFFVYVPCPKGVCSAELFGDNRQFDVAINDYTGSNMVPEQAEYKFSIDKWKYPHIKEDMKDIVSNYKACAFIDDDIKVSTEELNRLFTIGMDNKLNIWHPALTLNSHSSWQHLYQRPNSSIRPTNTVEIMAPFFSKAALAICWDTLNVNYSAWGIEIVWFHLLKPNTKTMIIDAVPVTHTRPMRGHAKVMPNGKTPTEEEKLMLDHYGLTKPKLCY